MAAQHNLLLASSSLFILSLHFFQTCHAKPTPFACGIIRTISYPFWLDHNDYSNPMYKLGCENNVTTVDLESHKYHVKAINYNNFTIRVAYVSLNNTNICSFPNYSVSQINFYGGYPYSIYRDRNICVDHEVAWPIHFLSCPYPLMNSSLFTEATRCSSHGRYSYVKVGHMHVSEVMNMCRVDLIMLTSWKFKDLDNVSLSEIHESLLYGFELSWFKYDLDLFRAVLLCLWDLIRSLYFGGSDSEDSYTLRLWRQRNLNFDIYLLQYSTDYCLLCVSGVTTLVLMFLLLILAVIFSGISLAVKIVIGLLFCAWGILLPTNALWLFYYAVFWIYVNPTLMDVLGYTIRFICGISCIMWLLIYKFRRRHLSMFDEIEGFLQSDNNLMPVRYSYSELKKITRGFREKIGEGGFGSVYKGKLTSGIDVAVKLLGKSDADGEDFINEMTTIGRIHHVNVVKLVGYCAERSERALVFDFMPNGSLEKYIRSREKMNVLNWDMKFDIALGVARGIEYLHRGCNMPILHFDIKPHNILLDDNFIPKISDFGLAKIFSIEKNNVTLTTVRGTIGYVAPEIINRSFGAVSYKADVYSFGMLLIDIVGLNRDLIGNNDGSSKYFPDWIYDHLNQGKDIEIEDASDCEDIDSTRKLARKTTIVALWCIRSNPDDRPSMNKVLEMLEGDVAHLQMPDHTPQFIRIGDQTGITCSSDFVSLPNHEDTSPNVEITVQE